MGHVFKLGTRYSEAMGALFLDASGAERPLIMGCYGIGIGRTAAASIEQNHDEAGIIWPRGISPFDVEVLAVNARHGPTMEAATSIYRALRSAGLEVLLDDRDIRAGIKFKDADLIGIPLRVTVGERNLRDGLVEIRLRRTGEVRKVAEGEAAPAVEAALEGL